MVLLTNLIIDEILEWIPIKFKIFFQLLSEIHKLETDKILEKINEVKFS